MSATREKRILGVLGTILVLQFVVAWFTTPSSEALWEQFRSGRSSEKVESLHALLNRRELDFADEEFLLSLTQHEDPRIRELAMTINGTRFVDKKTLRKALRQNQDEDEKTRQDFFLRYQGNRMTREDLRRYLEALP